MRHSIQPTARIRPNSRVRWKSESSIVLPMITPPLIMAELVLPLTAAWRYTSVRSARPNSCAVRIVVS